MRRDRTLTLAAIVLGALAIAASARADVTVIYAPAAASAPLVARPVQPLAGRGPPIGAGAEETPLALRDEPPRLAVVERAQPPPILPLAPREPPPAALAAAEPEPARDAAGPSPPRDTAEPSPPRDAAEPSPPRDAAEPSPPRDAAEPSPPAAPEPTVARPPRDTPPPPAALPPAPTCPAPIVLVRASDGSDERASLPLVGCDGAPDPESLVALSVLARPRALARPSAADLAAHASHPELVAPGVRRLHPGLLERVRAIADRFPGHAIEVVSGFRPDARAGSRHLHGLALDLRVLGASLDAVHALVSRFDRTGIGLYPAAGFVHVDVRERTVRWTDESAPGEAPRPVRRDDPPRSARPRRAARAAPTPTPRAAGSVEPDAIADEVVRGLGDLSLPQPPRRSLDSR